MHFSLAQSMELQTTPEQTLVQESRLVERQRMDLRLEMNLPADLVWDEPEGQTALQEEGGRPLFEIRGIDLSAYAQAAREAALVVHRSRPDALLVAMRGAHPFGKAVRHLLCRDPTFGQLVRRTDGHRDFVAPPVFPMATSYFLADLAGAVRRTIARALDELCTIESS